MKRQLVLICMTVLFVMQTAAQTDSTFYYLDKSGLTNNILCNFHDTVYWGKYNGLHDKKVRNLFSLQILHDINNLTFSTNTKPSLDSIKLAAANEIRLNNKIPIFIIHCEYTRIIENALEDSLLIFDEGKYYDVIPRPEEPYETDVIFIAQPLKEKINAGSKTFLISRDFFISNLPDPDLIEIDFDDGSGFRVVSFGQTISITYTDNDIKNINTKITYNGNTFLSQSESDPEYCQPGYPDVDKFKKITSTIPFFNPSPYVILPGDGQGYGDQISGYTSADIYIKFGSGHQQGEQLVKPLIFIEGIDFGYDYHANNNDDFYGHDDNKQDDNIRNGDVGWCEFWGESYDPADPFNYLKGNIEFKYSPSFLNALLAEGYDIMLVDFYDGADFIQRNAMVIIELLNWIQSEQSTGGYAYEPSVVIGASMGGQVAKYALSYMEQNDMRHCTRNYISFDSPHQGANIPLSIQQWMEFFANNGFFLFNTPPGHDQTERDYKKRFLRPATRQLLVRQWNYPTGTQDRDNFQNTMNSIGYPQKLRKVAIANGSKFGATQQYLSAGQQILDTEWSPNWCLNTTFLQGDCYTTGSALSFAGKAPSFGAFSCMTHPFYSCAFCANFANFANATYVQSTSIPFWDNAPGGNRNTAEFLAREYNYAVDDYMGLAGGEANANPTNQPATPRESFIPTISALDLNTSNLSINTVNFLPFDDRPLGNLYPFDAYFASATNTPHVQLEHMSLGANSNLVWGLNEILSSQRTLPFVLDANSPNSGVYNLARYQNRYLGSVTIGNGGNLYFNANIPSDFGASTVPLPPGGTPPPDPGSTLYVETCDCNGITIDVQSGGQFIIGDNSTSNKAIVTVNDGANFYLRDGAILKIQDGSKLIIEEGANFYWENGAQIILEGADAILEIKSTSFVLDLIPGDNFFIERGNALLGGGVIIRSGTITMNTGSTIEAEGYLVAWKNTTFNYNVGATIDCVFDGSFVQFEGELHIGDYAEFTFSGTGHFKFGLPTPGNWTNIHTGDNATILFEGSGPTDDIVFVFKDTWISNPPAPFTIRNGRVSLGNNSYISIGGDVELNNIEVKKITDPNNSWHTHNGIYIHGQEISLIERLDISGGKQGLTCRNFFGPSGVTIKESRFHNNGIGVHVFDKKVNFINCDFSNNGIGWSAANMSWNSSALNCLITDNDTGSFFRTAGTAQLILDKCSYLDNYFYGANFAGQNSFIIKCGTYTNWLFGLASFNNSDLILSPLLAKGAGKVDVSSNEISNILLGFNNGFTTPIPLSTSAKSLHLERGYNKLAPDLDCNCGLPAYQLWGRVRDCLNIDNNQWGDGIPGDITNYDLHGYQDCPDIDGCHWLSGCPITDLTDNDPKWHLLCYESSDPPSDERSFIEYCPDCPIISSENFEDVIYNEAFLTALNTTTEFDTLNGNDLLAFNMFYEITEFGFYYDMVEVKKIQSLAYNRMKNLLVTLGENDPNVFGPSSEEMARSLAMVETFITYAMEYDDDILEYHSYLDQANFHYLAGNRDNAIAILLQLPDCIELDSNLTAFANQRLCFYYAVDEILEGRQHVMRFDTLLNDECYFSLRTGIGLASANIDTVIYSVNPISSPASITDNMGNTYLATTVTDSSDNFAIVKTLSNQSQDWQFTLDGWNMGIDSAKVITADAAGYVYAAGKAWNGFEFNLVTAKINSDGEPVWTAFYNFPGMDATPVGISIDSNFIVSVYTHIADSLSSDYALVKYNQCDTSCFARMGNVFENVNLNNPIATEEFSIYPNPANDVLTVQYSTFLNRTEFQLIDITGRIVIREQLNSKEDSKKINISFLPSGIYSAIIVAGDKIQQVNKLAIVR